MLNLLFRLILRDTEAGKAPHLKVFIYLSQKKVFYLYKNYDNFLMINFFNYINKKYFKDEQKP